MRLASRQPPLVPPPSTAHVARRRACEARGRYARPGSADACGVIDAASPTNGVGAAPAASITTATAAAATTAPAAAPAAAAPAAPTPPAAPTAAAPSAAAHDETAGGGPSTLVPSLELTCATLTFVRLPDLPLPRLSVRTHKRPISDADVVAALDFIAAILERREWFTILYDLRESCVPSRAQLKLGIAWAGDFTPQLDACLCGIGIVLTSRLVRSVVRFVLHVCKPPVPQCVVSEQAAALNFARSCAGPPAAHDADSSTGGVSTYE